MIGGLHSITKLIPLLQVAKSIQWIYAVRATFKMQVFCALLLILSTACGLRENIQEFEHVIYIDPTNPNSTNDTSCYTGNIPCADINMALAFPERQHSTMFVLTSKVRHSLANKWSTTVFMSSSNIAIHGDGTKPAVVECKEGAGLAFISSSDISLSGVEFRYCGSWRNSTNKDFSTPTFKLEPIRVSLYFYECQNVIIENTNVINSTESLGVIMYSTVGTNRITNSIFGNNRISRNNAQQSGGGGFTVEFNYCKPGDTDCSEHNHQTENIDNAMYTFENCSFIRNRAIDHSGVNDTNLPILPQNSTHSSFGRGAGLALFFKGTAYNNTITINNCKFLGNRGNWGGGLYTLYADSSIQNRVYVSKSVFSDNYCRSSYGAVGGGAFIISTVHYTELRDNSFTRNLVAFDECQFIKNRALTGGALSFVFNYQRQSHFAQVFQANLSDSNFESNWARLGSAVSVDHQYFFHIGDIGSVYISSCSFIRNAVDYLNRSKPYSVGIGALYISEVQTFFQGKNIFEANSGSALALIGTQIILFDNSSIKFVGNTGSKGSALSLLGVASLVVGENTELLFANNTATLFGGAIYNSYIGREDFRSSVKCFLQYIDPFTGPQEWKAHFKFVNNSAGKLGNSIYSTTILPCSWSDNRDTIFDTVDSIFCWNESTWVYENSTCKDEIYTNTQSLDTAYHTSVMYPGHPFQLNITVWDDLSHNVTKETIFTAVTSDASTAQVDPEYAYIADGYLSVSGRENQNVTLELDVAGFRDWHLSLSMVMQKCPPGFKPADNVTTPEVTCECIGGDDLYTYRDNLLCDEPNLISKIRNGYWIGYIPSIDSDTLLIGATSLPYRFSRSQFSELSRSYAELDTVQCLSFHRTGPLCGQCISNYSTAVNSYSYECVLCDNSINKAGYAILYIVLTYLPYLVMFGVIIYFELSLMSGPEVGFILHAQLVGAGVLELTRNSGSYVGNSLVLYGLQKSYRIVYGIFNLDSLASALPPFCIGEAFSALDILVLDYAVAIFTLVSLLCAFFALRLYEKCQCCKLKFRKRSLINPIIAFLYLSYTKFTLASINILATTGIIKEDGSEISTRLIYYAGQYYFGQTEYLVRYGLLAIFVLIFISFLLPILLLRQLSPLRLLNWISETQKMKYFSRFWSSTKVNTFLDAIHSCYKPKYRWFAGMYFFFRLSLLLVYAFSFNQITKKLLQQTFCIVMIALIAYFQPYKEEKKLLNFLDLLILINITIINSISIYTYASSFQNAYSSYPIAMYSIGYILIWIPLFYMLFYLLSILIIKKCPDKYSAKKDFIKKKAQSCIEKVHSFFDPSRTMNVTLADIEPDSDTALFNRAAEPNKYTPLNNEPTQTIVSVA